MAQDTQKTEGQGDKTIEQVVETILDGPELMATFSWLGERIAKRGRSLDKLGKFAQGARDAASRDAAVDEFNSAGWKGYEKFVFAVIRLACDKNYDYKIGFDKTPAIQVKMRPKTEGDKWSIVSFKTLITGILKPRDGSKARSYESCTRDAKGFWLASVLGAFEAGHRAMFVARYSVEKLAKTKDAVVKQGIERTMGWFYNEDREVFNRMGQPKPSKTLADETSKDEKPEDKGGQQTVVMTGSDGEPIRLTKLDQLAADAKNAARGEMTDSTEKALLQAADEYLEEDNEKLKAARKKDRADQEKLASSSIVGAIIGVLDKLAKNDIDGLRRIVAHGAALLKKHESRAAPRDEIREVAEKEAGALNPGIKITPVVVTDENTDILYG